MISVFERFMAKIADIQSNGCWEWPGALERGYGHISGDGPEYRTHYAHRYSYELFTGPIPDGLEVHHTCSNRACVNPDHLEAVTRRENMMRGATVIAAQARQTHCKRGHELSPHRTKHGQRVCLVCKRARERSYDRAKRAARNTTSNNDEPGGSTLDETNATRLRGGGF